MAEEITFESLQSTDAVRLRRGHKSWCFTLNNYTDAECESIQAWEVKRIAVGKEVAPTTGTPHLQGFVCFKSTYRLSALKKLLPRANWHPLKAEYAADHAWNYCVKENPWFMRDNRSPQGERTDWHRARQQAIEGQFNDVDPSVAIRYHSGLEAVRRWALEAAQPRKRTVTVEVHWGDTGCGKSHAAWEEDAYFVAYGSTGWTFNAYKGQDAILLDEFKGMLEREGSMSLRTLLTYTDGYPIQVQIRQGSTIPALWTKVFITSNEDIESWYPNASAASMAALHRRITRVYEYRRVALGVMRYRRKGPPKRDDEPDAELIPDPLAVDAGAGAASGLAGYDE